MKCSIQSIIFKNDENHYHILTAVPCGKTRTIFLTGVFPYVIEGMTLEVEGDWYEHPVYGKQFKVTSSKEVMPSETDGIERYLSGGFIKGIGPATAKSIVKMFGDKTFDIIDSKSPALMTVKGISKKKAEDIWKSWDENKNIRDLSEFLLQYNVSPTFIVRIYNKYKEDAINIIKENPYTLVKDINGMGFITVDNIAIRMGVNKLSNKRIDAGIYYTLQINGEEGNTCLPFDRLIIEASNNLMVDADLVKDELVRMENDEDTTYRGSIIIENGFVFIKPLYNAEKLIASNLHNIKKNTINSNIFFQENDLKEIEEENNIKYDNVQLDAITKALKEKVLVITGGPGTGKTTITKAIINMFEKNSMVIKLAAPTGKAAKRIQEVTGSTAVTIHRLLQYTPEFGFKVNHDNPLDTDVLIIDEFSMVNVELMEKIMDACTPSTKVILIGDVNQLPAIGPGNVLSDIIESGEYTVIKLEKIYRQGKDSNIVTIAHDINKGIFSKINNEKDDDLFFIKEYIPENILDTIIQLVSKRLPNKYKFEKPVDNIQVLAPMKKGMNGIINYNNILQSIFNPNENKSKDEVKNGDYVFRVGDKVMQIQNDYDKNVMNGDTGYITDISKKEKKVTIQFDEDTILFNFDELSELILAYASTIHKSQGSEYPVVIIPVTKAHYNMLERNLIYTAITRAKKLCIIVGEPEMFSKAINTINYNKRETKLIERIKYYA